MNSSSIKINIRVVLFFLVIFFAVLALSFFLPGYASAQYTYVPMENIPGAEGASDFPGLILGLYKFGIWAVGIAAILMITIGGFMYLTSAGNMSKNSIAKDLIKDAIIGLIVALSAYLILYVINPDLVRINISLKPLGSLETGTTETGGVTATGSATCIDGKCTLIDGAISNNAYGVEQALLKAMLVGGEGCNKGKSSAGACGYSQTMPSIRAWCGITGSATNTCNAVQNDVQLDVNCAAKVIKMDFMKRCGTGITQLASCYNTGKVNNCANSQNNYCSRVQSYYSSCKN